MMVSTATLVRVEEWEGLYVDGYLVAENHSLDVAWELDGRSVKFKLRQGLDAEDEYVMNEGGFPSTYQELLDLSK